LPNPLVIAAMKSEADCLGAAAICCGIGPVRAQTAAEQAISGGATALISFGTAGGLDPSLRAGTVVLSQAVIAADGQRFEASVKWLNELAVFLPFAICGIISGQDKVVATVTDKKRLFEATGAIAVDMESHAIAAAATAAGVSFMAIRVITDTQARRLPGWLSDYIGRDGTVDNTGIALQTLLRPLDWGAMFGLALDSRKAHRALRRVAAIAGPGFGLG